MGSLFSKKQAAPAKKPDRVTDIDRALLDLKVQKDKLTIYVKKTKVVVAREDEVLRELVAQKNKEKALLVLRKKKYQEKLIGQTEDQILNVEQIISTIEQAQLDKEVFEALKVGNKALQDLQKEMNIDDVDRLMSERADALAYQEEINNALTNAGISADDEEVLKELQELENSEAVRIAAALPAVPSAVPVSKVEVVKKPVEEEKKEEAVAVEEEEGEEEEEEERERDVVSSRKLVAA